MKTLNDNIKKELEKLLGHMTRAEIALECGISQSTLSRLLKKHNLTKSGYGSRKLNFSIAQEIRKIYGYGDHTQKEIAELFKVSQPTIHKIINNLAYKTIGPKVTGEANVKVGYNY